MPPLRRTLCEVVLGLVLYVPKGARADGTHLRTSLTSRLQFCTTSSGGSCKTSGAE